MDEYSSPRGLGPYIRVVLEESAAAIGLAAAWCGPAAAVHCPPVARALRVPLRLEGLDGVALTFDDGPHPEGTSAVLAALAQAHVTATFFLVGEQVERYPAMTREIVAAGHEPAVHGYRHHNQMRLLPRAFARDLQRAIEAIAETCGRQPRLYRPPYGVFTPVGLSAVRRSSLEPLLWSKWGRDWRANTTSEEIAALASRELSAGDVVLLHDADWYSSSGSHMRTAAAIPELLERIAQQGLRPVAAR
jgi:peptidoglycan/xylan/chitin deacetylase (PgdA/CDA1 family)